MNLCFAFLSSTHLIESLSNNNKIKTTSEIVSIDNKIFSVPVNIS